jgi:hypothetical protein
MREIGGHILFSATDLMRFMGCAHATMVEPALKTKKPQGAPVVGPKGVCHAAFKLIFPKSFAQPSSHSAFEEAGIKHKSLVEQVSRAD